MSKESTTRAIKHFVHKPVMLFWPSDRLNCQVMFSFLTDHGCRLFGNTKLEKKVENCWFTVPKSVNINNVLLLDIIILLDILLDIAFGICIMLYIHRPTISFEESHSLEKSKLPIQLRQSDGYRTQIPDFESVCENDIPVVSVCAQTLGYYRWSIAPLCCDHVCECGN